MADVRSVHTLLQRYDQHLAQLEELRALLHDRLGAARALGDDERAAAVEAALERMDRGVYGVCRRCGALIAFERLLRAPERHACDGCAVLSGHGAAA
ncbi:hypothetical protein [Nonomuraea rhodomycinica]|uniref:DksA C4-type domain-containing protein n=1 Tax=Nonomuraea rhodomycinica TaxID=1712872 RepID=A0A7Y6IIJ7_9ACTN|nr:hypothetical protein [Nonomuraea rhodomycinica]NUW38646.1 hypothetical protein [Nonomuraea rhodomycinica]